MMNVSGWIVVSPGKLHVSHVCRTPSRELMYRHTQTRNPRTKTLALVVHCVLARQPIR